MPTGPGTVTGARSRRGPGTLTATPAQRRHAAAPSRPDTVTSADVPSGSDAVTATPAQRRPRTGSGVVVPVRRGAGAAR
jgi:hypothetical protein